MARPTRVLSYVFIIAMAIITLFPFVQMFMSSFMSYQEATSIPPTLVPASFRWSNFSEAMKIAPFGRYFLNTVLVASLSTLGVLVTSILAAFALVCLDFKRKNLILLGMISLQMIPYEVVVFTNFYTIARLGLLNTYTALILPSLASIFYIFYLKEYLTAIPLSFYKAAKVLGCSDLEFIWKIMIPQTKPALFTIGILSFIGGWNSFLWPILITNETEMRLLSNGLAAFATESGTQVQLQMAASTIAIVPILAIYLIFRKQIISGVARDGVKG